MEAQNITKPLSVKRKEQKKKKKKPPSLFPWALAHQGKPSRPAHLPLPLPLVHSRAVVDRGTSVAVDDHVPAIRRSPAWIRRAPALFPPNPSAHSPLSLSVELSHPSLLSAEHNRAWPPPHLRRPRGHRALPTPPICPGAPAPSTPSFGVVGSSRGAAQQR